MMNFTFEYSENSDFHEYFFFFFFAFESQECYFPRFSMFSVLYSISLIFPWFLIMEKIATLNKACDDFVSCCFCNP